VVGGSFAKHPVGGPIDADNYAEMLNAAVRVMKLGADRPDSPTL
jgi:hypothetical protein